MKKLLIITLLVAYVITAITKCGSTGIEFDIENRVTSCNIF